MELAKLNVRRPCRIFSHIPMPGTTWSAARLPPSMCVEFWIVTTAGILCTSHGIFHLLEQPNSLSSVQEAPDALFVAHCLALPVHTMGEDVRALLQLHLLSTKICYLFKSCDTQLRSASSAIPIMNHLCWHIVMPTYRCIQWGSVPVHLSPIDVIQVLAVLLVTASTYNSIHINVLCYWLRVWMQTSHQYNLSSLPGTQYYSQ